MLAFVRRLSRAVARLRWPACVNIGLALAGVVMISGLAACDATTPKGPGPLVAQPREMGGIPKESTNGGSVADIWEGSSMPKIEFGRVVQSTPVTIDGRRTFWGSAGGAVVGAGATAPTRATTGQILTTAVGTVTGAVIGGKVEEVMTRKQGQEIVIRLEEDKLVTVTQDAENGYFLEGDYVKVIHGPQGAYVSLSSPAERADVRAAEARADGPAWYERDATP